MPRLEKVMNTYSVRVAIEFARRVLSSAKHTLCRLNTVLKARGVAKVQPRRPAAVSCRSLTSSFSESSCLDQLVTSDACVSPAFRLKSHGKLR